MKIDSHRSRAYRRLTLEQQNRVESNWAYLTSQCQRIGVSPVKLKRAPFVKHGPVPLQDMTAAEIDVALADALSLADARAAVRGALSTSEAEAPAGLPASIPEDTFRTVAESLHSFVSTGSLAGLRSRVGEAERVAQSRRNALEEALRTLLLRRQELSTALATSSGTDDFGNNFRAGLIAAAQDPMWELLTLDRDGESPRIVFGTREPVVMIDPGTLRPYDLGHWALLLNLSSATPTFHSLRNSSTETGCRHPHVLDGHLCYGEVSTGVARQLADLKTGKYSTALPELLRLINRVFWTYNSASAYKTIPTCRTTPGPTFVFARTPAPPEPVESDELGAADPGLDEVSEPSAALSSGADVGPGERSLAQALLLICRSQPDSHFLPLTGALQNALAAARVLYQDCGSEDLHELVAREPLRSIDQQLRDATWGCMRVAAEGPCYYRRWLSGVSGLEADEIILYTGDLLHNYYLNFTFNETPELRHAAGEE